MATVTFTRAFDYKPTPRKWDTYAAGETRTVKRECADRAIAEGAAFEVDPPTRDQAKPRRTRKAKT